MAKHYSAVAFAMASLLAAPVTGQMGFPNCEDSILAQTAACDPSAAAADRAAAVVSAMKIEEKLHNLADQSRGAERIGLPSYMWWNEALHGVALSTGVNFTSGGPFSYATSFGNPILTAAAFDDDMVEEIATIISTEARAFANTGHAGLDYWTPNVNPYKDPRWGRGHETPGEDPFRVKQYAKHFLRGMEGTDPETRKLVATCKHYAGYDLERWHNFTRFDFDAIISLQDLSEYYLPPFQQCARDSKVGSIMTTYNAVNGTPTTRNTYLMTDILRNHWGWTEHNNYITTDCGAVETLDDNKRNELDTAKTAAMAVLAGTDILCNGPYPANITLAYESGMLSEAAIDVALARIYEGLVRVGYFDPADSSPYRSIGWPEVDSPEARELALSATEKSMVLKKNDGTLPLNLEGKSVALIGFWANDTTDSMLGTYTGIPPFYHTPLYAAKAAGLKTYHATGPLRDESHSHDNWTTPAMEAANNADVILYFGGNDRFVAAEELDREEISLPTAQMDLIEKISSLNKPMVVLQLGDQSDDAPLLLNNGVSAIIWAGYPGQSGGTAALNLITGKASPAGRLPVTQYPAKYVQQVGMTDMALRPSATNPGRTYRWYKESVLPFGHGLHYTTFKARFWEEPSSSHRKAYAIEDLMRHCSESHATYPDQCPFASIPIAITNTGDKVSSDFVALAFLTGEFGPQPYPIKSLVGYTRAKKVTPGEQVHKSVKLTLGNLARVDSAGNLVLYPGSYKLLLDEPTQDELTFTLTGEAVVLDNFPQPDGGFSVE